MTQMEKVVQAVREAGFKDRLSVMIGGAPVTESFRESIGAEYYSDNATGAAGHAAIGICRDHYRFRPLGTDSIKPISARTGTYPNYNRRPD